TCPLCALGTSTSSSNAWLAEPLRTAARRRSRRSPWRRLPLRSRVAGAALLMGSTNLCPRESLPIDRSGHEVIRARSLDGLRGAESPQVRQRGGGALTGNGWHARRCTAAISALGRG